MVKTKNKKRNYTYAVGRRREAVARVRLFKGDKEHLVNNLPIGKYFEGAVFKEAWTKPFALTNTGGKYFITVRVVGGGKKGQLTATVLGTARAFTKLNTEKFRPPLKKAGLLTRDARAKQRRMVGTGGKARRQKQSPKR